MGAAEAWGDGTAAFNDGESPLCLAYRLCRASFAGFDSGRALLAGGVRGVGGGGGEGTRRPDRDTWSPSAMHAQVRGRAAEKWLLRPAPCQTELVQERLWLG